MVCVAIEKRQQVVPVFASCIPHTTSRCSIAHLAWSLGVAALSDLSVLHRYQSADQIRAIVLEATQVSDGHHALIDEIMDEDELDLP